MGEVAKIIGALDDVVLFYTHLGMKNIDVKVAEQQANTNEPIVKARTVLLKWRQSKGKAATRDAILEAMAAMESWTEQIEAIQQVWNKQS